MKKYIPKTFDNPKVVDVVSAWGGIANILKDIIERFGIETDSALEFGVERGYSTSALANYFKQVTGVDKFYPKEGFLYSDVCELLEDYKNIRLVETSFERWIKKDKKRYDLIHIDILHEYAPTFACGDWACQHSDCVIFHDTVSFPEVARAVADLAVKHNFEFYSYEKDKGLGILVKNNRFIDFSPLKDVLLVVEEKDIRVKDIH